MSATLRNHRDAETTLDYMVSCAIAQLRVPTMYDLERNTYVARRTLREYGYTPTATAHGTIVRVESGVRSDGSCMATTRSMRDSDVARNVAAMINDWTFPDTPPIDSTMVIEMRGNIEILTNCLSAGVIGADEKELYTELKDDFTDLGLTNHSVAVVANGDLYDPRFRFTVRRGDDWKVTEIIWLAMRDYANDDEYLRRATDCDALIKGLCNVGKVEFSGSYQYHESYG
jgi:hypothetical protein